MAFGRNLDPITENRLLQDVRRTPHLSKPISQLQAGKSGSFTIMVNCNVGFVYMGLTVKIRHQHCNLVNHRTESTCQPSDESCVADGTMLMYGKEQGIYENSQICSLLFGSYSPISNIRNGVTIYESFYQVNCGVD